VGTRGASAARERATPRPRPRPRDCAVVGLKRLHDDRLQVSFESSSERDKVRHAL